MRYRPKEVSNPQFHRNVPGVGTRRPGRNYRKINIGFSEEDFRIVRRLAARGRISFAERVRTLVEWGLKAS